MCLPEFCITGCFLPKEYFYYPIFHCDLFISALLLDVCLRLFFHNCGLILKWGIWISLGAVKVTLRVFFFFFFYTLYIGLVKQCYCQAAGTEHKTKVINKSSFHILPSYKFYSGSHWYIFLWRLVNLNFGGINRLQNLAIKFLRVFGKVLGTILSSLKKWRRKQNFND